MLSTSVYAYEIMVSSAVLLTENKRHNVDVERYFLLITITDISPYTLIS